METDFTAQIIKQVITAWAANSKVISNFFSKYEDAYYLNEVAPGRNRAIYLLGHLIASNDSMLPMFDLGEPLYPELVTTFLRTPDKTEPDTLTIAELKQRWETLNTTLAAHFDKMQTQDWMSRHTRVSEEDFALEPTRNKLNVLIGRTNHQQYHYGQLTLLTQKVAVA
ncbi:DinB family protein [Mucilaginibacter jinjuensis]|uniref:DinB family protein n=1 Tax=Mucilaginibacter jinjuensis TaxID=1176721 RepID=A0ABY7T9U0_9SPHI|nr:DinB family protein [Mucilaginibacter jinjuensis]WCT13112.1 DinB family protein [Mucilaginibacter jinjuensis]